MTIDLIKLKALATAAAANQYNAVALNDYGTAVPPATVLGLIAEIERYRQTNAEGCKPDSNILLSGLPCAGAASCRSLDKAEGCKPDLNSPIHPEDMAAITKWHNEFLQLTEYSWPDDASALQDQAYALGRSRGKDDRQAESRQASAERAADLTDVLPSVAVEGEQLVIRITTECLLHAVTCAPEWPVDYRGTPISILNGPLLVQDIINELQREDEQGTNQMHRMLDQAALDAINNGSEAVSYD